MQLKMVKLSTFAGICRQMDCNFTVDMGQRSTQAVVLGATIRGDEERFEKFWEENNLEWIEDIRGNRWFQLESLT